MTTVAEYASQVPYHAIVSIVPTLVGSRYPNIGTWRKYNENEERRAGIKSTEFLRKEEYNLARFYVETKVFKIMRGGAKKIA